MDLPLELPDAFSVGCDAQSDDECDENGSMKLEDGVSIASEAAYLGMEVYPHCPIFIPSKGRSDVDRGGTLSNLVKDLVPFTVVVEAEEVEPYHRLLDSLVFRYYGESHFSFSSMEDGEKQRLKKKFDRIHGDAAECYCCAAAAREDAYAKELSNVYHHGYVFAPLQSNQDISYAGRSDAFTLSTLDEVRRLFTVAVLPESNKGVSYVRNYILHVLMPRLMAQHGLEEPGVGLDELDVLSQSQRQGISDSVLRRWGLEKDLVQAVEKYRTRLDEKQRLAKVHGLEGYYWVMDDDIHSFVLAATPQGKNPKGGRISPRQMMCDLERRIAKMTMNRTASASYNPSGSIFTCKEEVIANNTTAGTLSSKGVVNGENYEYVDKTAIFSLEYSRYAMMYDNGDEDAIAINSYNNIACLFRYDLLHVPTTQVPPYFPAHSPGVRSAQETLVGYLGNMMWYRFAVREDYDFTLQLISRGYYTVRFRRLGFDVPQMTKLRGGMTEYYKNCQEDIVDQNKRFVEQWPSVSQRCFKGKNSTRREDIRIRWDLLHPAKTRYPGAYLHLKELLPQIAPISTEKSMEETMSPLSNESVSEGGATMKMEGSPSLGVNSVVDIQESVQKPLQKEDSLLLASGTKDEKARDSVLASTKVAQNRKRPHSDSSERMERESANAKRWKGFTVERWRDIQPREAKSLGLIPIPPDELYIGRVVAVIPANFEYSPSVMIATLIDESPTIARHSALCMSFANQDEEVVEWTAASKVRGVPLLTVVHCYEVPSSPLEEVAARVDNFFIQAAKKASTF